nr:hypothetical protein CFP56_43864 [Quercus suber]
MFPGPSYALALEVVADLILEHACQACLCPLDLIMLSSKRLSAHASTYRIETYRNSACNYTSTHLARCALQSIEPSTSPAQDGLHHRSAGRLHPHHHGPLPFPLATPPEPPPPSRPSARADLPAPRHRRPSPRAHTRHAARNPRGTVGDGQRPVERGARERRAQTAEHGLGRGARGDGGARELGVEERVREEPGGRAERRGRVE